MHSRLLLVPASLIAASPVMADEYLTFDQARTLLFPGSSFTPVSFSLSDEMVATLQQTAHVTVLNRNREVRAFYISGGGILFIDQVPGHDDWITYAVALNDQGIVKGIEIMECVERFDQIRMASWRAQFAGKKHATFNKDKVTEISGTTLSSTHIADGVARILAVYALIMNSTAR